MSEFKDDPLDYDIHSRLSPETKAGEMHWMCKEFIKRNEEKAKDYCACCERSEVLGMLIPEIKSINDKLKFLDESTEGCDAYQLKRIIELEKTVKKHEEHLANIFNMVSIK